MAVTAHNPVGSFARAPLALALAAALACFSSAALATEWKITPRLDVGETYTDNVLLAPSGSAKSDWITQVTPGVSVEASGAKLRVKADYALQNLIYANESSRNSFYHQLSANANATLVERTLFLDAKGSVRQQATTLLGPLSNDNLNPSNITDVSSYSLSPYLLHKFGSTAIGELRFTRDAVSSGAGGLSDSSANRVDIKLNSGPAFYDLGWGVAYRHEKTDYNLRQDTESRELSLSASYRLTPKLLTQASVGYEKNNYFITGSKPEDSFWSLGLNWAPTSVMGLNVSMGERYFGKTYILGFNYRTARTTWNVGYNQGISSTRNEILNPLILGNAMDTAAIMSIPELRRLFEELYQMDLTGYTFNEILDAAKRAAAKKGIPETVLGNQLFLSKQLFLATAFRSGKSVITLNAHRSVNEAQEKTMFTSIFAGNVGTENTVKQYGLSAQWNVHVSTRDTASLSVGLSRNVFPTLSRTDNFRYIKLGMARKLERKLTGSLDYRHSLRDSNVNETDYTENSITGKLLWVF